MHEAHDFKVSQSASPATARPPRDDDGTRRPRRPRRAPRRLLAVLLVGLGMLSAPCFARSYDVEVNKSERLLILRDGKTVVRTFPIALGRGGKGDKQRTGDNKTPTGTYRIVGLNDKSQFDTFLRLNYPNVKDAYYGMKDERITRAEFRAIVRALHNGRIPPQDTPLGGSIGIHGIGEETKEKLQIHEALDWTRGCIALRNEDIQTLRRFIDIGTRVVIRE